MGSAGKQPNENPSEGAYPTPNATPAPENRNGQYQTRVEEEASEQPAAPGGTTQQAQNTDSSQSKSATSGPQQPAASGSTPQAQNTDSSQSKSATSGPEQPAASGNTSGHAPNLNGSEKLEGLPDPDVPLPSIETDAGQESLRTRRRNAINHVLSCTTGDFWAMLSMNPTRVTQIQAATTYRRLSYLIHPDKQEEKNRTRASEAQKMLNAAKVSEGYKRGLPFPTPVTPEAEKEPELKPEDFRVADIAELGSSPLFEEPKDVKLHQRTLYKCARVLELMTLFAASEDPTYPYNQARMNLNICNNTLQRENIKYNCPAAENLIDIDGLGWYFIRFRLARYRSTFKGIQAQLKFFVKQRQYPKEWIKLVKPSPDLKDETAQHDTDMPNAPKIHSEGVQRKGARGREARGRETQGKEGKNDDETDDDSDDNSIADVDDDGDDDVDVDGDEDFTDPGYKPGYTPLGEMIVAHRKVGRDGYQLLVATGHKDCPFYQLRPASDYLRAVADAYFDCQHAKRLTNTPLQGQYKGILHWAEEYSRPGALKKPVGVGLVAFHDKDKPEWAYRTIIEKFQKSRRGVDEAIELCKKREAKRRVRFYAKHGVDLPKPDYRQGLDERRQAKQRQDSNTFDPTSFSSFVCWWEKKNDVDLVKNADRMSEMMGKWTAIHAVMS